MFFSAPPPPPFADARTIFLAATVPLPCAQHPYVRAIHLHRLPSPVSSLPIRRAAVYRSGNACPAPSSLFITFSLCCVVLHVNQMRTRLHRSGAMFDDGAAYVHGTVGNPLAELAKDAGIVLKQVRTSHRI